MKVDARRVVVVGAGVTGLLTAIRCAQSGHRVTVLDAAGIPNPASSSFDQHRAIRALDPADPVGTRRAAAAHRRWLDLETVLGTRFYRRVGVVTAWPADEVDTVLTAAAAAGLPVAPVEPDKLPHIRFPSGATGLLEYDAGVLLAQRVLRAAAGWLARHPAVTLRPGCRVTAVDADSGRVTLAGGAAVDADLAVVAAGPWSRTLVDLPLVLYRQTMVYLRPPDDLERWWGGAPSAGRVGADGKGWLLPSGDGTLLKISSAAACREVDSVVEAAGDRADDEHPWAERILAASILVDLHRYPVAAVKRCHYAVDARTGAGHLVRLGPAAWARAASGGDGFRSAPLAADRIADAVSERRIADAVSERHHDDSAPQSRIRKEGA